MASGHSLVTLLTQSASTACLSLPAIPGIAAGAELILYLTVSVRLVSVTVSVATRPSIGVVH